MSSEELSESQQVDGKEWLATPSFAVGYKAAIVQVHKGF